LPNRDVDPAVVGAFFSGVGAVVGGFYTLGRLRKRMDADCARRIREIHDAMREGFEMREQK